MFEIFKDIPEKDYSITENMLYKQWTITDSNYESYGIAISEGTQSSGWFDPSTEATNSDGTYMRSLYDSVKHLYYDWATSSSLYVFGNIGPHISRSIHDHITVISIPQKMIGERIKSGSIWIEDKSNGSEQRNIIYIKDVNGMLIGGRNWEISGSLVDPLPSYRTGYQYIGNVCYEHGILVITHSGSIYDNIFQGSGNTGFTLNFRSTARLIEHEVYCPINRNEFNSTYNRSLSRIFGNPSGNVEFPSSSLPMDTFYSGSWVPYITTIGLYSDPWNLVAVGKLSRPIPKDPNIDLSFIVRFDT